jgi:hypothetical protein
MTLLAIVNPNGLPCLVTDVLLSRENSPATQRVHPLTGVYIDEEEYEGKTIKPAGFCRKVLEVNSHMIIGFSGSVSLAAEFAEKIKFAYEYYLPSGDELSDFLNQFKIDFPKCEEDLTVQVLYLRENIVMVKSFGRGYAGTSPVYGEFSACGSGADYFTSLMKFDHKDIASSNEDGDINPISVVLSTISFFLFMEMIDHGTFINGFGGAFEVYYPEQGGFSKVDDVMHVFQVILFDTSTKSVEAGELWPFVIRQWYQGRCLYVTSVIPSEVELFLIFLLMNMIRLIRLNAYSRLKLYVFTRVTGSIKILTTATFRFSGKGSIIHTTLDTLILIMMGRTQKFRRPINMMNYWFKGSRGSYVIFSRNKFPQSLIAEDRFSELSEVGCELDQVTALQSRLAPEASRRASMM